MFEPNLDLDMDTDVVENNSDIEESTDVFEFDDVDETPEPSYDSLTEFEPDQDMSFEGVSDDVDSTGFSLDLGGDDVEGLDFEYDDFYETVDESAMNIDLDSLPEIPETAVELIDFDSADDVEETQEAELFGTALSPNLTGEIEDLSELQDGPLTDDLETNDQLDELPNSPGHTLGEIEEMIESSAGIGELEDLREDLLTGELDIISEEDCTDDSSAVQGAVDIRGALTLDLGYDIDSLSETGDVMVTDDLKGDGDALYEEIVSGDVWDLGGMSSDVTESLESVAPDFDEIYAALDREGLEDAFADYDIHANPEQLDHVLTDFGAESWESLSDSERRESIGDLSDFVIEIVDLQSPPTIDYYYNQSEGDYGGFNSETNTLRINEYMLYDSDEAADTIAHEIWHAYQYERAANPKTPHDWQYRHNFDNYIRPELGQEAYESQLVEAEARAFAAQFKEALQMRRGRAR